jgi:acyl-CoA hydrolase
MVNCSETYTEVFEIVFPEHCNSMGITFGGQIMKWMEYAAAMAANRFCRSDLMVVSIDALNFKHSTKLGDIVTVRAMVSANFLTSIEVYVTVEKETLNEGVLVTNDGWVTIVSTGEGSLVGKDKRPVHKAIAVSKLEVQRQQGAEERRIRRLKDAESIRSYSKISNPQDFAAKPLSK